MSLLLCAAAWPAAGEAVWTNPPQSGAGGPPAAPVQPRPTPPAAASAAEAPPQRAARAPIPPEPTRPAAASAAGAPPQPAARSPASADLSERASRFISAYWDMVGDSGPAVLEYLRSSYAPIVDYYGKSTRMAGVLADKQRYLQRWPSRTSWPASGAAEPQIACTAASGECTISGSRDFANSNPATGAHAAGRFDYRYTVGFRGARATIHAESSTVTARDWR